MSDRTAAPSAFSLQSALPVLSFLVVNRIAGLRWAVVVATIWSVVVLVQRRRSGLPLGRAMPIITAAVILRGAIGAITGSETVYFGIGIASKYVVAAALLASVVLGRPLAALAAPYVFDAGPEVTGHARFRSTMSMITVIAGLYYTVSASFDVWLFNRSSVEGFVLIRFLANWPLSALAIVAIVAVAQRGLRKIPGVTSLPDLVEARFSQYWPEP